MKKGINDINKAIIELRDGATKLKEGSDTYTSKYEEFDNGLREYKTKGIDKLSDKTKDITELKDILDNMSEMAKENSSISGSTEEFETKSRIIEKIR